MNIGSMNLIWRPKCLGGKSFSSGSNGIYFVNQRLNSFAQEALEMLETLWETCINLNESYVGKLWRKT